MLLCFTPTDIDLLRVSRPSAGPVDTQNHAWDILVGGAHGSKIDKHANAIQALGLAAGDPAAVRLAEEALGDKGAYVRAAATKALGALGSTESIPKLQNLVNDKDISVALAVGHALVPAGGYRACNVRQERYCALFSRCRSSSVDSDRARKWEPVTLKAVVGPVMGNSLEVGNLARARALIEKNAKRTILRTHQVLTF